MANDVMRWASLRWRGLVLRHLGFLRPLALFFAVMGPGLITGIVDNDPTGIAGYAIAGSRFGYDFLWVLVLSFFILIVVNEMSARMGTMTGKGLADIIRERFGVRITTAVMIVLLLANATTIVAEFAGVAGASEIFGVSRYISVPLAAGVVIAVVLYGSYRRVEKVLLVGSLVFIAYIITGFLAEPDWSAVSERSVVPTFHLTLPYLTVLIGLIGTTVTPWMQFYLQSSVVDKGLGEREYNAERVDVYAGSFAAILVAFFIVVTTAATLFVHDRPADTVEDVARSLEPLAGDFASNLFAIGLLNASLLAATVLPLSTAYAVCGAFGWERSINRSVREAPAFFGLFGGLIVLGALAVLIPGLPLLIVLFVPNVVNGILLPLVLVLVLKIINDSRIMGRWTNNRVQNLVVRTVTAFMLALSAVYAVVAILEATGVINT
jgi:NRAMP (natural resistance-associated macrophage protein)-like metal ion transporter